MQLIDNYGRRINYARISVTDLCNLRCRYCMPEKGVVKKSCKEILRAEDYILLAETLTELGVDKIRLTGGEPLVRRGIITLARKLGSLQGLKRLSITTNGILLPKYGEELYRAGINGVNISIDTLNPDRYSYITRGGKLSDVLDGLKASLDIGFDSVKINVVLMKAFNEDEIGRFIGITKHEAVDVRFIELMPFSGQQAFAYGKFLSGEKVLAQCPELIPEDRDDMSTAARYYKLPGAKGRVGLILPISRQFCRWCNRVRFTADGHILNCLHNSEEVDLRDRIKDKERLKDLIIDTVKNKPLNHSLIDGRVVKRDMVQIGG